jgi:Na+/melibiose symporter-like transporter
METTSMTNNQNDPAKLDSQYRTMLILWAGFLFTIVIYLFLSFVLSRHEQPANRALTIIFNATSAFLVALSFVAKRKFLSRSVEAQDVRLVNTALISAAALCEAAALLALLDFVVAQDRYYFVLIAFSFLGLLLHFPRRSHLEAASFQSTHVIN